MRAVVYRNLNRGGWSVAEVSGKVGKGRVIDHVESITLRNVVFKASVAGAARVCRRGQRDVHAWAVGEVGEPEGFSDWQEIAYNPFRSASFHTRDGNAVTGADIVHFAEDQRAYGRSIKRA